uniref:Uncharacterized protein n=1 Tax=Physcomitrium patens TaxID=3218 RepID=A0A2K1JZR4_PHYPA|nr:hypothetical protein PHYPA_014142 [Physcomitrium patens]
MRTKTIHKRNKEMELGFSNPIEFDLPDIQCCEICALFLEERVIRRRSLAAIRR